MKLSSLARRYSLGLAQKVEQKIGWTCASADANKVYMFHSIDKTVDELQPCSITVGSFEKWLTRIVEKERFFPLGDIEHVCGGSFITFDDIYQSVADSAVPLLQKHGIPFTCFVATGYIDVPGYISANALERLAENDLCTIGSHTLTHPLLAGCGEGKLADEMRGSKERLQEMLGRSVDLFAYPYGSLYACSKASREQARAAGYRLAFSTINRPVGDISKEDCWYLPRINVMESNWERY